MLAPHATRLEARIYRHPYTAQELLKSDVTKALAQADMTLISLKNVLCKNTGVGTFQYAINFTTAGGARPDVNKFCLLKPQSNFVMADGTPFYITLSRELLAKSNACVGCHRLLGECTCASGRSGPGRTGGTKRQRDEEQASTLQRYMQMQRKA